ncbi:DinB family protein [Acinetobacter baumannii]
MANGTCGELTFKRFNGEEVTSTVESIVLHVANHGTYHRGELRGLCRAAGWEDFPETDFFLWDRLGRP